MILKYITASLVFLILFNQNVAVLAQTQSGINDKTLEKLKAKIEKLGVGKDSKIKVTLKDETKLNGFITARDENGFDVTIKNSVEIRNVKYTDIKKAEGKNSLLAVKIALSIGVVVGALYLIGLAAARVD
jgi:pectate lyase